jgi:hypothetical protein
MKRSPSSSTTEGTMGLPSMGIGVGFPASSHEMTEFVVPRSIPNPFFMVLLDW